jgi:transposase-like protein
LRACHGSAASSIFSRTPAITCLASPCARGRRDLRAIFDAPDRAEADRRLDLAVRKYEKTAPKLAAWLAANVPEALTVSLLPPAHRRRLRTSNLLERLNKEIKRRTRVATLFPNEAALLRLVSAVLMEISEEWETDKVYLRMENSGPTTPEE